MTTDVEAAVAQAFRDEWGRVVATLIRVTGDWDLAEECAQDAFMLALQRWPRDGIPRRPGGWRTTTARNRATDRLRRDAVGAAKLRQVAALSYPPEQASGELARYHLLPATRADLLRRLGRAAEAAAAYREALALVSSDAERRFLSRRLGEVTAGS